jgi:hypothetical protein
MRMPGCSPPSRCGSRRCRQRALGVCQCSSSCQEMIVLTVHRCDSFEGRVDKESPFTVAPRLMLVYFFAVLLCVSYSAAATGIRQEETVRDFFRKNEAPSVSGHTNNWAVLVCASRYWFNYRVRAFATTILVEASSLSSPIQHMANALGMCVVALSR